MTWLLDTVAVSELRSSRANPGLVQWADEQDPHMLFLSAISALELEIGVQRKERSDPRQGAILRGWLDDAALPAFGDRILPFDLKAARLTARTHIPDPRPERDAMIAGTALAHGLTIVTRNIKDFEPMGVPLHNPWTT